VETTDELLDETWDMLEELKVGPKRPSKESEDDDDDDDDDESESEDDDDDDDDDDESEDDDDDDESESEDDDDDDDDDESESEDEDDEDEDDEDEDEDDESESEDDDDDDNHDDDVYENEDENEDEDVSSSDFKEYPCCVNCKKRLKYEKNTKKSEKSKETNIPNSNKISKKELLDYADKEGIEIPEKLKKVKDIRKALYDHYGVEPHKEKVARKAPSTPRPGSARDIVARLIKQKKYNMETVMKKAEKKGVSKKNSYTYIKSWMRGDRVPFDHEKVIENKKGILKFK